MANIIINNYAPTDYNIIDTTGWGTDLSGNTIGNLTKDGVANNYRELNTTPFNTDYVWRSTLTPGSHYSGGFISSKIAIDYNQSYRYSIWVKRNNDCVSRLYLGFTAFSGVTGTDVVKYSKYSSNGADYTGYGGPCYNVNFSASDNWLAPFNEWRFFSFTIYKASQGLTAYTGGVYDTKGSKLYGLNDYIMGSGATFLDFRYIGPYTGAAGGIVCDFSAVYPRLDMLDGTEPSIQELINGSYLQASKIGLLENVDNNLVDISDWRTDLVGNTAHFNSYKVEAENYRKLDTNPWGVSDYVWANSGITVGNLNCGGWNHTTTWDVVYPVDPTKSYRCSVWVKRKVKSTAGYTYYGLWTVAGPFGSGNFTNNIRLNDGHSSTNHYFWYIPYDSLDTYLPQDVWKLCVGYVRPSNWTGTTTSADAGLYTQAGVLQNNVSEYKFSSASPATAFMCSRCMIDSADINAVMYSYLPRIDLVDGTEPSIQQLLSGTPKTNLFVLCEEVFPQQYINIEDI